MTDYEAEQTAKIAALNQALGELTKKLACWWTYSVSHDFFELVIGDPQAKASQNVVIRTMGTEKIAGPTSWQMQRLEVTFSLHPKGGGIYQLLDPRPEGEFFAQARMLTWFKNFDLLDDKNRAY